MFARKFPMDTAGNVLRAIASCNSQLGLTSSHSCINQAQLPITASRNEPKPVTSSSDLPSKQSGKLKLRWFQSQQQQQQQQQ